jgi:long-subunit fatty acid transport protein
MTTQQKAIRCAKLVLIASSLWLWVLGAGEAVAGGLLLYEVSTADVGLASAGWGARAQDASAVLTNLAFPIGPMSNILYFSIPTHSA